MIRGPRGRGGLERGRRLDCLERKKFDYGKISDFVFEFNRCNAKRVCFANFLDVR
jgi:hypothetical protein